MLLFFAIVLGGPVALIFLFLAIVDRSFARSINYAFSVASAHRVIDVVTDGSWTAGIDPASRTLVVVGSNGRGYRFTYNHVASVELRPIYSQHDEGTATTSTNRGSQLIGAGLGAAIAGPAGFVVGGLSGRRNTSQSSISTAHLYRIELKIRFFFDAMPVVNVVAPGSALTDVERIAARLTNDIDEREGNPNTKGNPVTVETILLTHEQTRGYTEISQRRGWWARIFGA